MKPAQDPHCVRHRFRREQSAAEYAFTQPRDLAVFVDFLQTASVQPGNLQANGVGSNIYSGKRGHRGRTTTHITTGSGDPEDFPKQYHLNDAGRILDTFRPSKRYWANSSGQYHLNVLTVL